MSDSFDPYYKWLAIPPEEQPANHYRLLGVKLFESDSDVISNAADGRMAQVRTFQNGEHSARSQQLLNELAAARVCLLNPQKKLLYDQKLEAAKTPAKEAPAPAAAKSSAGSLPKAPVQLKQAASLPVTPATAPQPVDFGFVQETTAPAGRKAQKKTKPSSTLLPFLAVGAVLVLGGITTGVWFLGASNKPATDSQALAHSTATKPPTKDQEAPRQPVEPSDPLAANKTVSGPTLVPTPIPADSPVATIGAVPDKPEPGAPRPDNEPAPTAVGAPAKEASPDANAPRTNAGPGKPDDSPAMDDRQPLPSAAARTAALELVKEVYKEDYAQAKKPADKIALAEKLLKQVGEETDPVQQFVLLGEARNLALAGSSPQLLAEVAHQLADGFVIDGAKLLADSLDKLMERAPAKTILTEMAEVAASGSEDAAAGDQFEQSIRLANLAMNAAKKAGQTEIVRGMAARASQLNDLAKQYQAAQEAMTRLAADPNDPEAHLALGKYLCFGKDEWDAGIPHLVAGNDPELQPLAKQEAEAPDDAAEQVKLADGWWNLAEASKDHFKPAYQRRAGWWYQQAQDKLTGLNKARIEKRLQSLAEKPISAGGSLAKKTARSESRNPGVKGKSARLVITEARYGTPNAWEDVTAPVRKLIHDNRLDSWPALNSGLPSTGAKKTLFIRYSLGDGEEQASFTDGQPVLVGVPSGMREAPRNEWVNVLPFAADEELAKLGWTRHDKELQSSGRHMGQNSLPLPVRVLGNYEIEMNCTRNVGNDLIGVGFPVDQNMSSISMGHRGNLFVLEEISNESRDSSNIKLEFPIESGMPHKLLIRIGHEGPEATIDVDLDGKKLNWKGDSTHLRPIHFSYFTKGHLNIYTHLCQFRIHSLKVRVVKGHIFVPANQEPVDDNRGASAASSGLAKIPAASGADKTPSRNGVTEPDDKSASKSKVPVNKSGKKGGKKKGAASTPSKLSYVQSLNFPERFLTLGNNEYRLGDKGPMSLFMVHSGLFGKDTLSFESAEKPGWFMVRSQGDLLPREFVDTPDFKQDASFLASKPLGIDDQDYVSLESTTIPGRFVRHKGFKLFVNAGKATNRIFSQDATFRILDAPREGN